MIGPRAARTSEPIIGYRNWRLIEGELRSNFLHDQVWAEPQRTARCVRHYAGVLSSKRYPHRAPGLRCQCGLYAWHNLREAISTISWGEERLIIGGAVVGWGRIQVHRDGFRAEHMRILAFSAIHYPLVTPPKARQQLGEAATRLGVPMIEHDHLAEFAAEHGAPAPVELRPVA